MFVDITTITSRSSESQHVPELVDYILNPFQPTVTFRPLSTEEAMILTSGGGTPTWRAIEPWDLPGYVEPAPLPSYLELFQ